MFVGQTECGASLPQSVLLATWAECSWGRERTHSHYLLRHQSWPSFGPLVTKVARNFHFRRCVEISELCGGTEFTFVCFALNSRWRIRQESWVFDATQRLRAVQAVVLGDVLSTVTACQGHLAIGHTAALAGKRLIGLRLGSLLPSDDEFLCCIVVTWNIMVNLSFRYRQSLPLSLFHSEICKTAAQLQCVLKSSIYFYIVLELCMCVCTWNYCLCKMLAIACDGYY